MLGFKDFIQEFVVIEKTNSDISSKLKVTIIEDEALFRDLLGERLKKQADFELVGAYASANEARRNILAKEVDLAFVDIELGEGQPSGIQLALELRETKPNLGIVLLSYHSEPHFAKKLSQRKLLSWGYLLKKSVSDFDALYRAVISVSQGGVVIDEQLVKQISESENSAVHTLTARQKQILGLVAQGYSNIGIGKKLDISSKSVENQLGIIYQKLGIFTIKGDEIHSRVKAVLEYLGGYH